jgi:hypothetical protein
VYGIENPALDALALIVRGADTALFAWCRDCRDQGHDWNPAAMIAAKP